MQIPAARVIWERVKVRGEKSDTLKSPIAPKSLTAPKETNYEADGFNVTS
jgi:hypothetical protein